MLIGKLGTIANAWKIRLDVKPLGTVNDHGALILLTENQTNWGECGHRNPILFFRKDSLNLLLCTCNSELWSHCFNGPALPSDVYTTIEIIQFPPGNAGDYKFNLYVNGSVGIKSIVTNVPASIIDADLYIYKTYHTMANANIKNIIFNEIK